MRNEEWAALLCCKVILHSSFKSSYFLVLIIRISNQYKENQSDHSYYLSGIKHLICFQIEIARNGYSG